MTVQKFRELCDLRIVLEKHAALLAMPFVTDDLLELLATLDRGIDEANAAGDGDFAIILNQQFHRAIYQANPYQETLPLIESVWLQLGPFLRLAYRD